MRVMKNLSADAVMRLIGALARVNGDKYVQHVNEQIHPIALEANFCLTEANHRFTESFIGFTLPQEVIQILAREFHQVAPGTQYNDIQKLRK
jgi:hypothetical protein